MSFPFFGEEFTFTQPDGTRFAVRGWGDQNHAVFETRWRPVAAHSTTECSLEQADGRLDLERGKPGGDDKDLFHAGWWDKFSDCRRLSVHRDGGLRGAPSGMKGSYSQ